MVIAVIPGGLMSILQPLDVSLNHLFKYKKTLVSMDGIRDAPDDNGQQF